MARGIFMKRIKIIATGGTISAQGINRLDFKDYHTGTFQGKDLLNSIPELKQMAHIEMDQLENFSSTLMNETHWIKLRNKIHQAVHKDGFDGVVITHGTNTLEETAYFLHLTINTDKPVVLVGAQRPFTALGSDGAINLLQAVRVAADNQSHGKGVLVVANDEINGAREVTKTNTYRLETFQSGQFGFLGYVEPDHTIQYYREPTRKHTYLSPFAQMSLEQLPRVEIIYSYAGADGALIRTITESKSYDGIILAGTGAGRCSLQEEQALVEAVKKGLMVVRSSRVGNGRVVDIAHYRECGFVTADNLLPQKARILLMLSMVFTRDAAQVQQLFNEC